MFTYLYICSFRGCCCSVKFLIHLQAPVRDKLEPVVFSLNMSLHEQKTKARRSLQNLDFFPVLSQEQKLTQRAEVQRTAYNTNLYSTFLITWTLKHMYL